MPNKMTDGGIKNAARELSVDEAILRAVIWVEANGAGFLPDGRPKILFERHKFHKLTEAKYDATYPNVSNVKPGGYGSPESEWSRLYVAAQLDADAAVMSASWGLGQIMGFNWKACGEKSLMGFVLAMHNSEDSQLMLMAQFIKSSGAVKYLRGKDFAGFAGSYNGPNYAINKYDAKLASAFTRFGGLA